MTRSELIAWRDENLDEIIALEVRIRTGINVISDVFKIGSLCRLNQELDRRICPPVMSGRVDIETELMEIN